MGVDGATTAILAIDSPGVTNIIWPTTWKQEHK